MLNKTDDSIENVNMRSHYTHVLLNLAISNSQGKRLQKI